jgi:hypothetical protein
VERLSGENISRYGNSLIQSLDILLEHLSQNSKLGEGAVPIYKKG